MECRQPMRITYQVHTSYKTASKEPFTSTAHALPLTMSIVSPESAPMTRSLPTYATADTEGTTGCNEIGDIENMLGSCAVSTHSGMGANDRCSGCSGNSDSCSTPR